MSLTLTEERLHGPKIQLLIDELLQLRIMKDKVDHPRKGSKDLSDAVCGAIYNAVALTPRDLNQALELYTYGTVFQTEIEKLREESDARLAQNKTIKLPDKKIMPPDLREFMGIDEDEEEERFRVDSMRIL